MHWEEMVTATRLQMGGRRARTRFAPSPTGYLHMGHVVNAIYVWGLARALDGEVVLRLENHDRTRCKPEFEAALLQDLEWLGLLPDLGKIEEFRSGACDFRQSDCEAHYVAALEELRAQGLVYACDCSRTKIVGRTGQADGEELRYDGHCRNRGLEDGPGRTLRVRLSDESVRFQDILLGEQVQHPFSEVGDVAIRDNHGHWTYQFAVVVDDIRHDINLIVRGMDILSSTGRQILMRRMLGGRDDLVFLHHQLLVDAQGRKLSKRDFSADIHTRFLNGESKDSVISEAVGLLGFEFNEIIQYLK
ncbi:MAG: glutamate--tRNA ligase family protein [Bacteroidia bacterium]